MFHTIRRIVSNKYFPIFILICINLIIGALVVTDYGESWDEFLRYRYAKKSLAAYFGESRGLGDEKGPFYVMIGLIGGDLFHSLYPDWMVVDGRHYINFISFQLALFFFYRLSYRFTNQWAAIGATLVFCSQPILWGHAFINPKDIPFMAFFLASVDTGFVMADSFLSDPAARHPDIDRIKSGDSFLQIFKREWSGLTNRSRFVLSGMAFISLLLLFIIIPGHQLVKTMISNLIQSAYSAGPDQFLGYIFSHIAENAGDIPVELYVQKTMKYYRWAVLFVFVILVVINYFTFRFILPETESRLRSKTVLPFLRRVFGNYKRKDLIMAGLFLGFASSIRILGPASGFLIAAYLIVKVRGKAIPLLIAYFGLGAVTTYLFWPALWQSPLANFMGSVAVASDFPWEGKVMFAGIDRLISELPRNYLPTLFLIQFTLTAIVLILGGIVVAVVQALKKEGEWEKVAVIALWFIAPVGMVMILQPTVYDNFRQFLFVVPPLFVFAALGLRSLFDRIHCPIIIAIVLFLLISPNVYWLVKLHPYQYVYYNQLVGGVRGAFREYEMDYWATSYKEATEFVNRTAPSNSKVIVWGAIHPVETYARSDLVLEKYRKKMEIDLSMPTYMIISSRHDKDLSLFPSARELFVVGREGAIYVVVRELDPESVSSQ